MDLSIIIPTYNGKEHLAESLKKISEYPYEIIIVDNHSDDGTSDLVKTYPHVIYLEMGKNYGYSKACNAGAKRAKGTHLLFLNNDCAVEQNAIEAMIRFLETHGEFIATQPIVFDCTKEIENIGQQVDIFKLKGEPVKDRAYFKKPINTDNDLFDNQYFYSLVGTCLMIRRDLFVKLEMFDESFHSYHEDIDFFMRATQKGYRYFPTLDAACIHEHMGTSSKMGGYKQVQDFKNLIRIIIKNYPRTFILRHFSSLFVERLRNLSGVVKKVISG